jgi:PTH1 family peptidyl-tRNA hydrolase
MKLVLGLGNPGPEYENTRHNIGFMCLRHWAARHRLGFSHTHLFDYLIWKDACLMMPGTYMNLSGSALAEAQARWRIEDTLVIHDDIELPLATLRIRNGGGDGGHNGIRSLLSVTTAEDLKRFRIGIGRGDIDQSDHVLSEFSKDELDLLHPVLESVSKLMDIYIKHDFNAVLDEYSRNKKSYSGVRNPGITSPKEDTND